MAKRPNYAAVVLILFISIAITCWAHTRESIAPAGSDLASLPAQIGSWTSSGKPLQFDKQSLEGWNIAAKDSLKRVYVDKYGTPLELMVIYKGNDRRSWHVSEMCFSGSGFNVKQSTAKIPYAGRKIDAVKLFVEEPNSGAQSVAIYFFARGAHTEHNFTVQQLKMALSRLHPSQYGWAYVRATSPVLISEKDTEDKIRKFFAAASKEIVRSLTTSSNQSVE
ncbi:MAG: exosortase C-terminal domain/associated protein EpsI [Armatimonadota bacterium]|jgi:EpsI family protein